MQDKTSKQQVYFSCCLSFLTTVVSHEVKSSNYQCRNLNRIKLITVVLIEITFSTASLLNNSYISQKIYFAKHFVQKSGNSKYCNFLNSKLNYGYFSANFIKYSERSCLLSYLQEHIFFLSINKSERMLS